MIESFALIAAWVGEKDLACEYLAKAIALPAGSFSSYGALKLLDGLSGAVEQRGAAIIVARGQSSAASAANAVIDTVRNVARPSGEIFSAAVRAPADASGYGIPEGLVFGYPLRATTPGQVEKARPAIQHALALYPALSDYSLTHPDLAALRSDSAH